MTPPTHQLAVCMKEYGNRSLFGGVVTPPYGEENKECVHEYP